MGPERLFTKSFFLTVLLAALAALFLLPMLATAEGSKAEQDSYNREAAKVTIDLSSKGIVATPIALEGDNYLLTVKNNTSEPRGIEMIGIDLESSPTVRYTKILQPGESETFRWYFATGKTTYVRDILDCTHEKNNCTVVTFGQMRKAIDVN